MYCKRNLEKKLEGRVFKVNNQNVLEVSNELPKKRKINKNLNLSFDEFKKLYRGVISDRCIAEYGNDNNAKLREDMAEELFYKSYNYIPEESNVEGDISKSVKNEQKYLYSRRGYSKQIKNNRGYRKTR